jgi:hypothetical protein
MSFQIDPIQAGILVSYVSNCIRCPERVVAGLWMQVLAHEKTRSTG